MTDEIAEAFVAFAEALSPTEAQSAARESEKRRLVSRLLGHPRVLRVHETGSFAHGTAVEGHSRVDLLVVLDGPRPRTSAKALESVSSVVVPPGFELRAAFAAGEERASSGASDLLWIADAAGRWVRHRPGSRELLISRIDTDGSLRSLIRLLLAWKHRHGLALSSYYLETAAIRQALQQPSFSTLWDVCWLWERLAADGLPALPDLTSPSQVQPVRPSPTLAKAIELQFPLERAASSARRAVNAYLDGDLDQASAALRALFGEDFPEL